MHLISDITISLLLLLKGLLPITDGKIFLVFSLTLLDCLKTVTSCDSQRSSYIFYMRGPPSFPPAGRVLLGYVHTIPDTSYACPETIADRASVYT